MMVAPSSLIPKRRLATVTIELWEMVHENDSEQTPGSVISSARVEMEDAVKNTRRVVEMLQGDNLVIEGDVEPGCTKTWRINLDVTNTEAQE